jgi:MFS family permease
VSEIRVPLRAHATDDQSRTRTADGATPPRTAFQLVRDSHFGTLFWGKLATTIGVWIHNTVASIVAFQITGSALVVGLISVAQFTPQLLLTPLSGKLTDLGHGHMQILLGRVLCTTGSAGLALWIWWAPTGAGGAWPLLVSSLVVGIGFSVGGPAQQTVIPLLIRPGELAVAMRLNNTPMVLARAIGPAIGAVMVVAFPPEVAFGAASTLHAVYLGLLLAVRLPTRGKPEAGLDQSIRAAVHWVVRDRALLFILLGVAATGIGSEPASTLAPSLAERSGQSGDFAGWVATAMGIGSVLGLLVQRPLLRWLTVSRQGSLGLWLMAGACMTLALCSAPWVVLLACGFSGVGFSVTMSGFGTLVQYRSPVALRGRIMALWLVGFVGSRPLSAAVSGAIADYVSLAVALLAGAAVVGVMAVLTRPAVVSRPLPEMEPSPGA